jgi:nitroreductase
VQTASPDQLVHQLNWRYATKKFDPSKKIPADTWRALEQALVLTPSSYGLQPWQFLVITDQAVKEKLVPISWRQTQSADCSHFVVFTARRTLTEANVDAYVRHTAEVRGVGVDTLAKFKGMMLSQLVPPPAGFDIHHWASLQVYIALGNFMTVAAMLGVDTCPMEGIERSNYDALLGLSGSPFTTVVACAAGYRAGDDKCATLPKVRFPAEDVVKHI